MASARCDGQSDLVYSGMDEVLSAGPKLVGPVFAGAIGWGYLTPDPFPAREGEPIPTGWCWPQYGTVSQMFIGHSECTWPPLPPK